MKGILPLPPFRRYTTFLNDRTFEYSKISEIKLISSFYRYVVIRSFFPLKKKKKRATAIKIARRPTATMKFIKQAYDLPSTSVRKFKADGEV